MESPWRHQTPSGGRGPFAFRAIPVHAPMWHGSWMRWLAALVLLCAPAAPADDAKPTLVDPQDGWFDMSGFLAKGGFVPMVSPVTEPAVGYGAAGGLIFLQRGKEAGSRPDIYALGGMYTESKS